VTGNAVEILDNPGITPGTTVELDNSWLIALQYYQRHQVPTPDEYGWTQYCGRDGAPLQPQRPVLVGSILAANAAGSVPTGRFYGKMIMLGSTMDVEAYPWGEDWYREKAESALGTSFSNSFRLWYMDNADHDPKGPAATHAADAANHIVSYTGEMQQALLDLDGWIAHGQQPPTSTSYRISADSQVQLPATAKQRRGLQPVVTLSASAGAGTPASVIIVGAGQPVTFSVSAEVPFGTGKIVRVEWDYAGSGTFNVRRPLTSISSTVSSSETHTFTRPGTYFPVVRVASHRNGDTTTPYGLIQNLASVRVVVE
jgi:hypothetical protein